MAGPNPSGGGLSPGRILLARPSAAGLAIELRIPAPAEIAVPALPAGSSWSLQAKSKSKPKSKSKLRAALSLGRVFGAFGVRAASVLFGLSILVADGMVGQQPPVESGPPTGAASSAPRPEAAPVEAPDEGAEEGEHDPAPPDALQDPMTAALGILAQPDAPADRCWTALEVVRTRSPRDARAVPGLLSLFQRSDQPASLRFAALELGIELAEDKAPFADPILDLLADSGGDPELRRLLTLSLESLPPREDRQVQALTKIALDRNEAESLRRLALLQLQRAGEGGSADAIATFVDLASETEQPPDLRRLAISYLRNRPRAGLSGEIARNLAAIASASSEPAEVRQEALRSITLLGPSAAPAVTDLLPSLRRDPAMSGPILGALESVGINRLSDRIDGLLLVLDPSMPDTVRVRLAGLIDGGGAEFASKAAELRDAVRSDATPAAVKKFAAETLIRIGPSAARDVAPDFLRWITDSDADPGLRLTGLAGLDAVDPGLERIWTPLIDRIRAPDEADGFRISAAEMLAQHLRADLPAARLMGRVDLNLHRARVEALSTAVRRHLPAAESAALLASLGPLREGLDAEKRSRLWERLVDWDERRGFRKQLPVQIIAIILLTWTLLAGLWAFLCLVSPESLLRAGRAMRWLDWRPVPGRSFGIGLRDVTLLAAFEFRDRVLDAWLRRHRAMIGSDRGHGDVPAPPIFFSIRVNGCLESNATPATFREWLGSRASAMIRGDRACGKSWLLTWIAGRMLDSNAETRLFHHPALPILLPETVTHDADLKIAVDPLNWIADLVSDRFPDRTVSRNLIRHLAARRRLWLLFDSPATDPRSLRLRTVAPFIRTVPAPDWGLAPGSEPAAAPDAIEHRPTDEKSDPDLDPDPDSNSVGEPGDRDCCEVLPLDEREFSNFLGHRLAADDGLNGLSGAELFEGCRFLSELISGRPVPIGLAALYADDWIAARSGSGDVRSAGNVGELMRSLVRRRNGRVKGKQRLGDSTVLRVAHLTAWACCGANPEAHAAPDAVSDRPPDPNAGYAGVRARSISWIHQWFNNASEPDASSRLGYLEEKLGILESFKDSSGDLRLRFRDPLLGDYLAAWHAVATFSNRQDAWREFFSALDENTVSGRRSFLQAIDDCLWSASDLAEVPEIPGFVSVELSRRLARPGPAADPVRDGSKIYGLLQQLLRPDPPDRGPILDALARLAPSAGRAVPRLVRAFRSPGEDIEVRCTALAALIALGAEALQADSVLLETLDDPGEHLFLRMRLLNFLISRDEIRDPLRELLRARIRDSAESPLFRIRAEAFLGSTVAN